MTTDGLRPYVVEYFDHTFTVFERNYVQAHSPLEAVRDATHWLDIEKHARLFGIEVKERSAAVREHDAHMGMPSEADTQRMLDAFTRAQNREGRDV